MWEYLDTSHKKTDVQNNKYNFSKKIITKIVKLMVQKILYKEREPMVTQKIPSHVETTKRSQITKFSIFENPRFGKHEAYAYFYFEQFISSNMVAMHSYQKNRYHACCRIHTTIIEI
jgi:hypothetical protein